MYLVGRFDRYESNMFTVENALPDVFITDNITKQHLINAKTHGDYQVINLSTLEFYNPEKNCWQKITVK